MNPRQMHFFFLTTTFSLTPETLNKCIQKIDIDFKVTFSVQKICTFKSVRGVNGGCSSVLNKKHGPHTGPNTVSTTWGSEPEVAGAENVREKPLRFEDFHMLS